MADFLGLRATASIFAALTLAAIPAAFRSLPRGRDHEPGRRPAHGLRACLSDGSVILVLLTGLLFSLVYSGVFSSALSRLIEAHYGKTVSLFGLALGAASIGGVLQALRWAWEPLVAPRVGRLSDGRSGRSPVLIAALAGSAILFALVPVRLPAMLWLGLVIAVLFTATVTGTVSDALACDVAFGSGQRMLMAAYTFAVDLGAAVGPLVAYAADGIWGPFTVYWFISGTMLLSAAGWYAGRGFGLNSAGRSRG